MKPHTALLAAALLASCGGSGSFSADADGYCWNPRPSQPDCPEGITWIQKPPLVVPNYCGVPIGTPGKIGCVLPVSCVVVSMYGEADAHNVYVPGHPQSHWAHETKHIALKLGHPNGATENGC